MKLIPSFRFAVGISVLLCAVLYPASTLSQDPTVPTKGKPNDASPAVASPVSNHHQARPVSAPGAKNRNPSSLALQKDKELQVALTRAFLAPPLKRRQLPLKEGEGKRVHQQWIQTTHRVPEGVNWKDIEASSIRKVLASTSMSTQATITGTWKERGPSNIPGRITDIEIDYSTNRMYALSDHGIVFRSDDLNGSNWVARNDQFPLGLDVASQLELFEGGLLVVSGWIKVDNFWGIYQSQDGGLTWNKSKGLSTRTITGIRRMSRQADTLYALFQEYDPQKGHDFYVVYKSVDKGVSFQQLYASSIPAGDGGRNVKSDLWVPGETQHPSLYLNLEDSLFIVNKFTGDKIFQGLISGRPAGQSLLTGWSENGTTVLHSYVASRDTGWFYQWKSNEGKWTQQGKLTDWWLAFPFGSNSFTCSKTDPGTLYFGGILASSSKDGGVNWTTMDLDPTGSFALYHGDVPKTMTTIHPVTKSEQVFIGTDGGIYRLDAKKHFNTLSIPGLNCTQIYKMVSRQDAPGEMFIGTQDNGYAHTALGAIQPRQVDFTFQWGGDVTNVASGDGGKTFWLWWLGDGCNYMTGTDQALSTWTPYDFQGRIPYWEAPVWIPKQFPDRCYTAGFLNNTSGSYIIELKANQNAQATPTQFDFNFEKEAGAGISAIAISPLDFNYFYVATANGYFFTSTDAGITWKKTFIAPNFYGKAIHPSSTQLGAVWVGGSGFVNAPLYYSADHGSNFKPFNEGMPSCMLEALATDETESTLFAATSVGPFAFDPTTQLWSSIAGLDGPIVHHMDVEYLPALKTARFATYARGVWDFEIKSGTTATSSLIQSPWTVLVTAAGDQVIIRSGTAMISQGFRIVNAAGKQVYAGTLEEPVTEVNVAAFTPGIYYILPEQMQGQPTLRFVKQ